MGDTRHPGGAAGLFRRGICRWFGGVLCMWNAVAL